LLRLLAVEEAFVPFQNEITAISKDPYSAEAGLFHPSTFARPAFGRTPPGAGFSIAIALTETTILAVAVLVAMLSLRSTDSLGWASWVALIGLPLSTLVILLQRQFYATHYLMFAPFRPFRLTGAWLAAFGTTVAAAMLARGIEPQRLHDIGMVPPELALLFGVGLTGLLSTRLLWALIRPRLATRAVPRVLFVGELDASRRLLAQLHAEPTINLVTSIDYRDEIMGLSTSPDGNRARLTALLAHDAIDAVLVSLPQIPPSEIAFIAAVAQTCGVNTVALPGVSLRRDPGTGFTTLGGVPVLQRDTTRLTPAGVLQKRLFDLVLGCIVLVIIAPIMAVIAVLIRLDSPGPVLFRQIRVGRGGTLFEIFKFRTMTNSASLVAGHDPHVVIEALQTQRDDQRVTRLGAILRRHSLDELPQIFNVLRGDMSIIGPRPHAAAMTVEGMKLEALVPDYTERFAVRPGITGWAQVNGRRGIIDTAAALQARVDHDLYYIENWSLGFDVSVLGRTVMCVIRDDQAF
jgi:exopolysaccharide biosynthesis polyprenyl glycosylphosphotransferase